MLGINKLNSNVCMCVCMYCIYLCMCICEYRNSTTNSYLCMYVCTCLHVHTYVHSLKSRKSVNGQASSVRHWHDITVLVAQETLIRLISYIQTGAQKRRKQKHSKSSNHPFIPLIASASPTAALENYLLFDF